MGRRRKSRELALQRLFKEELNPRLLHDENGIIEESNLSSDIRLFYAELVRGVRQKKENIDEMIEKHSNNWRVSRMAKVDLNILRVATYELLYCDEIPPSVTLNEAIEISKKFGSEDSPSFVNGVLDNILKNQQTVS